MESQLVIVLAIVIGLGLYFTYKVKKSAVPTARWSPSFLGDPNWREPVREYPRVRYWSRRHGWRNCYHVTTDGSGRMHLQLQNRPPDITVRRKPHLVREGWVENPDFQYLRRFEEDLLEVMPETGSGSEILDLGPIPPMTVEEAARYGGAVNP